MFNSLQQQPADKILALMQLYKDDPRENKIDLGVGVYKDASGQTPIMDSIKKAEHLLWKTQETKSYVGLTGTPEFSEAMINLLLGDKFDRNLIASAATPGGTGAVRQAFELGKMANPNLRVFVSDPTWPNHLSILKYLGIPVEPYRYFDAETRSVDFSAMMADLANASEGDIILLHGCCHNPTGQDMTVDQWIELAEVVNQIGALPFVDIAYQGFGEGIEEDVAGVRAFAERVSQMLLTVSSSKSFGIYRERAGLLSVIVSPDGSDVESVRRKLRDTVRQLYFMAPDHGAAVVHEIMSTPDLELMWREELDAVRTHVHAMRKSLRETLETANPDFDAAFVERQHGMFSCLPITVDEQLQMERDYHIYMLPDARVNVAAMNAAQSAILAEAFAAIRASRRAESQITTA